MAADPKYLPGEDPPDERLLAEQESELEGVLYVLVNRLDSTIEALYDRIAGSPDSSDSLFRIAHAVLLASYERKGIEGADDLKRIRHAEHTAPRRDPETRAKLLSEMRRLNGVRPSTVEMISEYLSQPQDPDVTLTDEEFEEQLADVYRLRADR